MQQGSPELLPATEWYRHDRNGYWLLDPLNGEFMNLSLQRGRPDPVTDRFRFLPEFVNYDDELFGAAVGASALAKNISLTMCYTPGDYQASQLGRPGIFEYGLRECDAYAVGHVVDGVVRTPGKSATLHPFRSTGYTERITAAAEDYPAVPFCAGLEVAKNGVAAEKPVERLLQAMLGEVLIQEALVAGQTITRNDELAMRAVCTVVRHAMQWYRVLRTIRQIEQVLPQAVEHDDPFSVMLAAPCSDVGYTRKFGLLGLGNWSAQSEKPAEGPRSYSSPERIPAEMWIHGTQPLAEEIRVETTAMQRGFLSLNS